MKKDFGRGFRIGWRLVTIGVIIMTGALAVNAYTDHQRIDELSYQVQLLENR